ncbi:unnamed protein product [Adineta steineri]|uniref:J domain-containing protein n=1 Tax=Adineta steineri TaxID=433720 RepID=A0A818LY07_9BILA|nr:unnamed protein product [Adineta steineri]CAF3583624.1 unnamed protein product [Adineta steineri]
MFRTSQKYFWINNSCGDCFHAYENIITSLIQSNRSILLTTYRYKTANINARNYYELLGIERTATQKEIKQAFFKLSKEYHPDSNSADKSLHNKFVKINEAFSILSKQSTRTTYDQSLSSISRSPYQPYARPPSADWSNVDFGSRNTYERRYNTNKTNWNASHRDESFYEAFRRKMESDRQRSNAYSYYYSPSQSYHQNYFAPISIILIVVGFGMFIHALQYRIMQHSNSQYAIDPRTRHYRAYREWQRLSALKDVERAPVSRESSSSSIQEEE